MSTGPTFPATFPEPFTATGWVIAHEESCADTEAARARSAGFAPGSLARVPMRVTRIFSRSSVPRTSVPLGEVLGGSEEPLGQYELTFHPQLGGTYSGTLHFIDPATRRYQWYTIEMTV